MVTFYGIEPKTKVLKKRNKKQKKQHSSNETVRDIAMESVPRKERSQRWERFMKQVGFKPGVKQ